MQNLEHFEGHYDATREKFYHTAYVYMSMFLYICAQYILYSKILSVTHAYMHACMHMSAQILKCSEPLPLPGVFGRLDGADISCLCPSFNCQAEISLGGRIL